VSIGPAAEKTRSRVLSGVPVTLWMWRMLPLAAFAGLRITRLDEEACTVRLPGGWRTRNPFGSAYFAAQAMAAEMSTGAPALVLREDAPRPVSMLILGLRASYTRRLTGPGTFTCADVPAIASAIARAATTDEPQVLLTRSTGKDAAGLVVAEFEVDWSFKRRPSRDES
jgi:acyl-coenzyme A thioesterase PaaI-like protein